MKDLYGQRKKGRPTLESKKDVRFTIRLNADEVAMLDYLMDRTGEKRSRLVREGLIMRYNLSKSLE